jgi:hypothetical protein
MDPEYMLKLLRVRPFEPLRVLVRGGQQYDIRYPNLSMVTQPSLVIAFPGPESGGRWGEDYMEVSWREISTVQALNPEDCGS